MTQLYTTDLYDVDTAEQGADLTPFTSDAEATAFFNDLQITSWTEARFDDCWIKLHVEPEIDTEGFTEIEGIKCQVQHPGTHPGGNAWWCTPVKTVMVPVYAEADDDSPNEDPDWLQALVAQKSGGQA